MIMLSGGRMLLLREKSASKRTNGLYTAKLYEYLSSNTAKHNKQFFVRKLHLCFNIAQM